MTPKEKLTFRCRECDFEQSTVPYSPKLGDLVYFPVDAAPFTVIGIREGEVEIYGDWSGGTHNVKQSSWVFVKDVEPYDESKVKYYDKNGKVITKKK